MTLLVVAAGAAAGVMAAMFATRTTAAPTCHLAGTWHQSTPQIASTDWSIEADGTATETHSPGAQATGKSTLSNGVLTIDWTTPTGYAGTYRWELQPNCSGSGKLTFTAFGPGDGRKPPMSYDSTVVGPPPTEPAGGACYLTTRAVAAQSGCIRRPVTPRSKRPRLGKTTSYAAPTNYDDPVSLPAPKIGRKADSAKVDVGMSRDDGKLLGDTDFVATVSNENIAKAGLVCWTMAFDGSDGNDVDDEDLRLVKGAAFVRCVAVVAQILQRAEKIRQSKTVRAAAVTPCLSKSVRLKGARRVPLVKVSCKATSTGGRITIRPARRGRTLRSALGRSPRLIIGRLRGAEPVQAGDRVNVRWTTS